MTTIHTRRRAARASSLRPSARRLALLGAGAVLAAGLAACGGGGEASEDGTTSIKLGMFPVTDVAPIYLGIEKGFFEDEGLSIEPHLADSGAAVTAAVVAGDDQIGFSNPMSLVLAQSQDLPVDVIAPGTSGAADTEDAWSGVLVREDSPIESPADLEGKTIAVNSLKNILEVTLRGALDDAGVDPSSVKLIELPFPDMAAAVENEQVDAAFAVEPYVTQATSDDARVVLHPYEQIEAELPSSFYFTTKQFAQSDPEAVEKFQRALETSVQYAIDHPDEARDIVLEYTEIDPAVVETMAMPVFRTDIDPAQVELYQELGSKYGLIDEPGDVDDLIAGWSGSQ